MSKGPKSLHDWIKYAHKAAQAHQADPNDHEAADAVQTALSHIQSLNSAGSQQDFQQAEKPLGMMGGTAAALAHGISLGTGEPIAGAISAVQGKGFKEGAQGYRDSMDAVESSNPLTAAGAEVLGPALLGSPSGLVRPAATKLGASIVPAVVRAAATGGTMGAVSGFSKGGEDAGDFAERGSEALKDGVIGAGLSAMAAGGAGSLGKRSHMALAKEKRMALGVENQQKRGALLDRRIERMDHAAGAEPAPTVEPPQAAPPRLRSEYGGMKTADLAKMPGRKPRGFLMDEPPALATDVAKEGAGDELSGKLNTTRALHEELAQSLGPRSAGQNAIPDRPDLGKLVKAAPTQTAGSPLRTATPKAPQNWTDEQIQSQIKLGNELGMHHAEMAKKLHDMGISAQRVKAILAGAEAS